MIKKSNQNNVLNKNFNNCIMITTGFTENKSKIVSTKATQYSNKRK